MSKKIFLSPSNQTANCYAYGNTTEAVQCGKIAEACKAALERSGFEVELMHYATMAEKVAAANAWGADLYICIHTNACNGSVAGTRMFYYAEGGAGQKACQKIFEVLAPITPGTSENIKPYPGLYEVKHPSAPTAYCEVDFHDVPSVAKWIIENVQLIGETIARGVCNYFGVTYKEETPKPAEPATPVTPADGTLYRVQVGAFAKRENAERMLKKLKAAGFDGYIRR